MEAGSSDPLYVQFPFDFSINKQQESNIYQPEKDETFVLFLSFFLRGVLFLSLMYFFMYLHAIDDIVHIIIIMSCWLCTSWA